MIVVLGHPTVACVGFYPEFESHIECESLILDDVTHEASCSEYHKCFIVEPLAIDYGVSNCKDDKTREHDNTE